MKLKKVFTFICFVLCIIPFLCNKASAENVLFISLPAYIAKEAESWWQPSPGVSWQWQLSGVIDTSIDAQMYDIDLFETPVSTIENLHQKGRVVICYLSAGSWEVYRSDADKFPQSVLGKPFDGWPDERWLDIREIDILAPLLRSRMDLAVAKGCDGIEPDNVDGYSNDSGFPLTSADQLRFNRWLSNEAHRRGLSIGLKNDLGQVNELVDDFDWALNEQCFYYNECELLDTFIKKGKAVFGVEYDLAQNEFCNKANAMNFDWLKKKLSLDNWRQACR